MKTKITKLEAAARQLDVAISLWFRDEDLIAVHTLAAASHQVVHDIVQQNKGPDLIFNTLSIKDEYRKGFIRLMKEPQNFFKHADKDPQGEIDFYHAMPEFFIMMTLVGLEFLKVPYDGYRAAFSHWFTIHHPEVLNEKGMLQHSKLPPGASDFIRSTPKAIFLAAYLKAHNE